MVETVGRWILFNVQTDYAIFEKVVNIEESERS